MQQKVFGSKSTSEMVSSGIIDIDLDIDIEGGHGHCVNIDSGVPQKPLVLKSFLISSSDISMLNSILSRCTNSDLVDDDNK